MQISIQSHDFSVSPALRSYAERRVEFSLPLENRRVRRVNVVLKDVNGPRGGDDKYCRVQVMMNGLPPVIAEEMQPDVYVAIDRATERVSRTLYRIIDREKERHPVARGARTRTALNDAEETA